jgi:hypothetical protein
MSAANQISTGERLAQRPEIWVVKGVVTDPTNYRGHAYEPSVGTPEWRVYDVDPASRDSPPPCTLHLELEELLRAHDGYVFNFVEEPPEDAKLFSRWASTILQWKSWRDLLDDIRDAALEQGILGQLLDGLDQRP